MWGESKGSKKGDRQRYKVHTCVETNVGRFEDALALAGARVFATVVNHMHVQSFWQGQVERVGGGTNSTTSRRIDDFMQFFVPSQANYGKWYVDHLSNYGREIVKCRIATQQFVHIFLSCIPTVVVVVHEPSSHFGAFHISRIAPYFARVSM